MPGTTSTALPSFSHDQHHKTDAAKRKGGGVFSQMIYLKCAKNCKYSFLLLTASYQHQIRLKQLSWNVDHFFLNLTFAHVIVVLAFIV